MHDAQLYRAKLANTNLVPPDHADAWEKLIDKLYVHSEASDHYGADEQMVSDVLAHVIDGRPLPVSVVDALEAGLLAIKIDEARRARQVIGMAETWQRFDAALARRAAA